VKLAGCAAPCTPMARNGFPSRLVASASAPACTECAGSGDHRATTTTGEQLPCPLALRRVATPRPRRRRSGSLARPRAAGSPQPSAARHRQRGVARRRSGAGRDSRLACTPSHLSRVVRSTTRLAHELGATVVAEGIGTIDQWNYLAALGCDGAQGYLIGHPQPAAELTRTLIDLTGAVPASILA